MNHDNYATEDWTNELPSVLDGRTIFDLDDALELPAINESEVAADKGPSWQIGAYVDEGSLGEVNRYALAERERGAEALLFRLYKQPDTAAIAKILKGLDVTKVGLHCSLRYPGQDPAELFRDLVTYLRGEGVSLKDVKGSVDFDPLLDWTEPPFPPLVRLLFFVSRWMPNFSVLQVNAAGFNYGVEQADTELALALAKGAEYLKSIEAHNYPAALASRHLQFALTVGTSFYGDVAKLRALRILWAKVLSNFGGTQGQQVTIAAHTDVTTLSDNWEENETIIQSHAQAAVEGGADQIFLTPLEQVDDVPTVRARNFAINIQQQIRASGSAIADEKALEVITNELVAAAWVKYQNLVAQGGFAMATEI